MTPRFKKAWRCVLRKGESLRSRALGSSRGVGPENIVWIFGTGRSGSTWLGSIMGDLDGCAMWNEPLVGNLFGNFHYFRVGDRKTGRQYILGEPYKQTWLGPMRDLVLGGAAARFPEVIGGGYLIIKEPNGSIGAPLLMEALPESRMIFLIRDPRDVVASRLDAFKEGSWTGRNRDYSSVKKLMKGTRRLADDYMKVVSKVQEAYEAHPGEKALVRYEDLRHDTVNTMKTMYAALEVEADEAQLEAAVEKHSWEKIPDSEKGRDKFFRKGQPGSWKDDLSPEQIKLIEKMTGPILSKYY